MTQIITIELGKCDAGVILSYPDFNKKMAYTTTIDAYTNIAHNVVDILGRTSENRIKVTIETPAKRQWLFSDFTEK